MTIPGILSVLASMHCQYHRQDLNERKDNILPIDIYLSTTPLYLCFHPTPLTTSSPLPYATPLPRFAINTSGHRSTPLLLLHR